MNKKSVKTQEVVPAVADLPVARVGCSKGRQILRGR